MPSHGGALGASLLLVFLAGAGCHSAWHDDPKSERKTVVKFIKVPDTHVIHDTKVVTVHKPLPESCMMTAATLEKIRGFDDRIDKASATFLNDVKELHRLVVKGDPKEFVPFEEEIDRKSQDADDAEVGKAKALDEFDKWYGRCQADMQDQ